MAEPSESTPPVRLAASPLNGVVPPVEHRFKSGYDPKRDNANRDTTGAIVKNYLNGFGRRKLRTRTIQRYADDENTPHFKRVAAERALKARTEGEDFDRIIEHTDGRPKQTNENVHTVIFRTPADRDLAAVETADRLRAILNPSAN